ncbi:MAG: hypothetical protein ACP5KX_02965 [Caldisericia bacterium]
MNLNVLHWSFVLIGLLATILSLIIVLRRKKNFLYNHKILATVGFVLINLSIIYIYLTNKKISLSFSHGILGFLFFILSIINVTLGVIFTRKIDTKLKKNVRTSHVLIGRIIFVLLILNIIIGYIFFKPF